MGGKGIMGTNSIMRTGITRREFVETSAGLVISFYLPAHRRDAGPDPADAGFAPNAWLRIGADDVVTLTVAADADRAAKLLGEDPAVRDVTVEDRTLRLTVTARGEEAFVPVLRILDRAGIDLRSVQIAQPTLDDVFLDLTGRSLRDAP